MWNRITAAKKSGRKIKSYQYTLKVRLHYYDYVYCTLRIHLCLRLGWHFVRVVLLMVDRFRWLHHFKCRDANWEVTSPRCQFATRTVRPHYHRVFFRAFSPIPRKLCYTILHLPPLPVMELLGPHHHHRHHHHHHLFLNKHTKLCVCEKERWQVSVAQHRQAFPNWQSLPPQEKKKKKKRRNNWKWSWSAVSPH
mgnify:CR=1 FL=1